MLNVFPDACPAVYHNTRCCNALNFNIVNISPGCLKSFVT